MTVERPIEHDSPDVSVVIPTIPENSHEQVVADLRDQTHEPFEVLVVNDDSLDICEARNAGVEKADADVVALTDDDCRPPEQWVTRVHKNFENHSGLVCLEGRVRGGRTYNGERKYVGCNLSFDRAEALAVGGFDSDFAGWRDDTEFGWRMERDTNGECQYDSDVVMEHPDTPRATIDKDLEQRLRRQYPDRYDEILIPDTRLGRLNDWLWRQGFWDAVDLVRNKI